MYLRLRKTSVLLCAILLAVLLSLSINAQTTLTTRAGGNWDANDTWISGNLTGSITTVTSSAIVTGTGTNFTTQLVAGAALYRADGVTLIGTVQSITSNTLLTLTANASNANTVAVFRTRKVPSANDIVVMANNGFNVTIPAGVAAVCSSLDIGVTNTNSAESLTFAAATSSLAVTGNVTMFGPTGNNTRQILLNAGALTVNGNLAMGNGNTGNQAARITKLTVTTGAVTVKGNLFFNTGNNAAQAQIDMSGGAGVFNLAGSFTATPAVGTLTAGTSSTFNFNGTAAQTITVGVSSIIYNNIDINNSSATGVTVSAAITRANVKGNVKLLAGKFNNNGFAITGNAAKIFQIVNGSTFNVSGTTSTFPTGFGTYTLGAASNVIYNGSGNQTIFDVPSPGYGNLTLSNGGTKTAASALDVQGDFALNGIITFTAGAYTHTLKGNWVNSGSTFNSTGSTIHLNGTTIQTITSSAPEIFNGLRINNSAGVTLASDVTVNGTLTFTNGIVNAATNNKTVTIGASGTNSGGSATSYINGKLARVITGTTAVTFPIGKGGQYRSVTFTYAAAVSKTVTIEQFESAFPQTAPASVSVARFSNRYWMVTQSSTGTNFTLAISRGATVPTGAVRMLRSENGGAVSVNATAFTSPLYRNSTAFTTASAVSVFTLSETGIPLTVTGAITADKVYDGTATASITSGVLSGVISPDVVTLNQSGNFNNKNVATNKTITSTSTIAGANAPAYTLTQPTLTRRNVTARTLTVTVTANSKTYNANTTATVTFSDNRIAGDVLTVASTSAVFANKHAGTGKVVTVSGLRISAGTDRTNYTLAFTTTTGNANITQRPLTVTGAANSKMYNGNTVSTVKPSITSGAVQTGDVANFTQVYNNKNAGTTKTMIPSGVVTDGNSGSNYVYTFVNSTNGTITKRPLTITAASNTKLYDGSSNCATLPGVTSGAVQSGDAAGFVQNYNNAAVGTGKTITASGVVNDGNTGNNYTYTFVNNTSGIINPLTVSSADFRTKGSGTNGNFSDPSIWQYDRGGGLWTNATQSPSLTNNITLQNNDSINLDTDLQIGAGKTFFMNASSKLVINPAKDLSVAAGGIINFNGQSVTVKSTAAGTGSIGKILGTLSGETNITVERYVPAAPKRAYRLLSVPTSGQTIRQAWQEGDVNGPRENNRPGFGTQITGVAENLAAAEAAGFDSITPSASLRIYNGSGFTGITNTNIPIATTTGYFIYIRGDRAQGPNTSGLITNEVTLRTTGTMYKGSQQFTGINNGEFRLVGNVYPSAIDFTTLALSGVANTFYIWDSKKYPAGGYETFSAINDFKCIAGGGSWNYGDENKLIESGQAFFVVGSDVNGSVILSETSKAKSISNRGLRPSILTVIPKLNTRLLGVDGKVYDGAVNVFDKAYSKVVDKNDALKLENTGESLSILSNGKKLAVEAAPALTGNREIAFDITNMKQQEYTLEFKALNIKDATAYLEDNYLNTKTKVDLNTVTKINFTVTGDALSAAPQRFKLTLNTATVASEGKQIIKISPNPVEGGIMNIQFTQQAKGRYTIRLVDLNGRTVYSTYTEHAGGNAAHTVPLSQGIAAGSYNAVITGPGKTRLVQKILLFKTN